MSRAAGGSRVTSWPSIEMAPSSGYSSPATRRSVVVLPAPVGPSRTTNSPSAMLSERSRTASTSPKRLPTCRITISAMTVALIERAARRPPARHVEHHQILRIEGEPHRLAQPHRYARRQTCLDLSLLDIDG